MTAIQKRLVAIACEVFSREAWAAAARSPHIVDLEFLPKSLHDIGEGPMSDRLQTTIDQVLASRSGDTRPDAIVLLYGLCNNGIRGLHAAVPLVVPRAHDCITLFLGSRSRYDQHFQNYPGTYYKTPGWIERDTDPGSNPASITSRLGIIRDYAKLVEQYGEDNAAYLMETMGDWFKHYRRLSFINTEVGATAEYRSACQALAQDNAWDYEEIAGDTGLINRLLSCDWNERDFLILQPGQKITTSHDGEVIRAEDSAGARKSQK